MFSTIKAVAAVVKAIKTIKDSKDSDISKGQRIYELSLRLGFASRGVVLSNTQWNALLSTVSNMVEVEWTGESYMPFDTKYGIGGFTIPVGDGGVLKVVAAQTMDQRVAISALEKEKMRFSASHQTSTLTSYPWNMVRALAAAAEDVGQAEVLADVASLFWYPKRLTRIGLGGGVFRKTEDTTSKKQILQWIHFICEEARFHETDEEGLNKFSGAIASAESNDLANLFDRLAKLSSATEESLTFVAETFRTAAEINSRAPRFNGEEVVWH